MTDPVQPTPDQLRAEIATLDRKIAASTGNDGKPLPGYRERIDGLTARAVERTGQLKALLQAQLDAAEPPTE